MKNQSKLAIAALALLLGACSPKLEVEGTGNGQSPQPTVEPFNDKVTGISLNGQYVSRCATDPWTANTFTIYSLTFQDRSVLREQYKFSDSTCQKQINHIIGKGQFRFAAQPKEDVYELEYKISFDDTGIVYTNGENIRLVGNVLWISDRVTGAEVSPNIPLYKTASGPQQPTAPVTDCVNYSGSYQMNNTYFKLTQTGCERIIREVEVMPGTTAPAPQIFITDGQAHLVGGMMITSYFKDRLFYKEYLNAQNAQVTEKWYFNERPCNLMNPSGESYLVREATVGTQKMCDFWSKR